jgi:electron transfer flavoprotein beta subunit
MTRELAVLLSVGRHPASGRPRMAPADARALELALRLAGSSVTAVHAGDPDTSVLRDYLGMGLRRLTVLEVAAEANPVPALIAHMRVLAPPLLLTGVRAEGGEDSGLVPYLVAEALGHTIASDIVDLELSGDRAELLQALPRGRRRRLAAALPLVATVGMAAPMPRQSAYGRARRGEIVRLSATAPPDADRINWIERPARPRPRRLRVGTGGTVAERLAAVSQAGTGRGRVLHEPPPEDAARAILDYLVAEGIVTPDARPKP